MTIVNARVALPDRLVEDGVVVMAGGKLLYAGDAAEAPSPVPPVMDAGGMIAGPGFVDIHCHGGGEFWAHENPVAAALHHLRQGTTSLLCSFWRNAVREGMNAAITKTVLAMRENHPGNIRGIHMEGPYLNPRYGSEGGKAFPIDPAEYLGWIAAADGAIRYWTMDPEQPGAERFAADCRDAGIVLGICYSDASPALIEEFIPLGLRIGSHILCATGAPANPWPGTREPGSDELVLLRDDLFAEVIADSAGAHVRPENIRFIRKAKGTAGIILITDCCTGGDTEGSDVNIINGELYGSRLTMNAACRNMSRYTGASLPELFRMASGNPARAVGLYGKKGSLSPGKDADLVLVDDRFQVKTVILDGSVVHRE